MKKTVLITGSTSGIGLAVAQIFAAENYNVIFNGLETDGAAIASQMASQYSINHLFSSANLRDRHAVQCMIHRALKEFSVIDILINNAGVQHVSAIEDFPEEKWDEILDVNLSAAFFLTKAIWPAMKKQNFGRIINIASAHGLVASK